MMANGQREKERKNWFQCHKNMIIITTLYYFIDTAVHFFFAILTTKERYFNLTVEYEINDTTTK